MEKENFFCFKAKKRERDTISIEANCENTFAIDFNFDYELVDESKNWKKFFF